MGKEVPAFSSIYLPAYTWTCLLDSSKDPELNPSVDNCFYVDWPGSEAIKDWIKFFTNKRHKYKLFAGKLIPDHKQAKRYGSYKDVWVLCRGKDAVYAS